MRFDPRLLALAFTLFSSRVEAVGGSITDGAASFVRTAFGASPAADFTGVSSTPAQDHLADAGWWFRVVPTDTQETPFPNPTTEDYSAGNMYHLTWSDLGGRGLFEAEENALIEDISATLGHPGGYVFFQLGIHNISGTTLQLVLYHFANVDLAGVADDSAAYSQKSPHEAIDLSDVSGLIGVYGANFPDSQIPEKDISYRVGDASTLEASLNDASVTGGANTGLPFGPGDFGGSYQFEITVAPDETVYVDVAIGIGFHVYCGELIFGIFCDSFETGDHSFWLP